MLKDLKFDTKNPKGAYKSKKFRLIRLCNPDIDDLGATHPDQKDVVDTVFKAKFLDKLWF